MNQMNEEGFIPQTEKGESGEADFFLKKFGV
jgi:hypothetical protein